MRKFHAKPTARYRHRAERFAMHGSDSIVYQREVHDEPPPQSPTCCCWHPTVLGCVRVRLWTNFRSSLGATWVPLSSHVITPTTILPTERWGTRFHAFSIAVRFFLCVFAVQVRYVAREFHHSNPFTDKARTVCSRAHRERIAFKAMPDLCPRVIS